MGAAVREQKLAERSSSVDDEFSDAVTTPVIEKKDLVAPTQTDKKMDLFSYLLDSFQPKTPGSEPKPQSDPNAIYSPEFYRTLYPSHKSWEGYYSYSKFSVDDTPVGSAQAALQWYYVQNCLEDEPGIQMEAEVVQKCAEELLNKDTALSVACLLRAPAVPRQHSRAAASAALYAGVLARSAPALTDHAYLAAPGELVRAALSSSDTDEQLQVIRGCLARLGGCGELERVRALGVPVDARLGAQHAYTRSCILQLARMPGAEQFELACSLAAKYDIDVLEVWLEHAESDPSLTHLNVSSLPSTDASTYERIRDGLWPLISGSNHNALIKFFSILKSVDEKPLLWGLTAADHIKLLKKVKAASNELNYKLLLEQPSAEDFSAHFLSIMRPENVGMVGKLLRGLPPACKLPLPVNTLYTMWLTDYLYNDSGDGSSSNKKWMQRYRQCASYFNKLAKKELLRFLADACFSDQALQRIPAGTRNLMLMQAVDYCQQEQENDFKFTKDEMSWTQVGQELTRWARFLENFHSSTIQAIVDASGVPKDEIWPDVEKSHGDLEAVLPSLSRLVLAALRPAALSTLLQCLHIDADAASVLRHAACCPPDQVPTLVTRVIQYHKEGVKLPEDLLEEVMKRATEVGLPPHKQIGLLALSQRTESGDLDTVAKYTAQLVASEWGGEDCVQGITDETLLTEGGRRETFKKLLERADSWPRKKALVDILNCWPIDRDSESRSLHGRCLHELLKHSDQKESLVLARLLLRKPALADEEVKWVLDEAPGAAAVTAAWVALLSRCESARDLILKLAYNHKDSLAKLEIEDDLVKELLDSGMFIKLVPTAFYPATINYVVGGSVGEPTHRYTVQWAIEKLIKENYIAEAGQLQLLSMGVPAPVRGFTQSVLYCKNIFKK